VHLCQCQIVPQVKTTQNSFAQLKPN